MQNKKDSIKMLKYFKEIKSSTSYDIVQFIQSITILIIILVGIFLVNNNLISTIFYIIIYIIKSYG